MKRAETFQKIFLGVMIFFSFAYAAMADGERLLIENQNDTALFQNDLMRSVVYTNAHPLSIIYLDSIKYLYAVVRDRFGNFVRLADSAAAWTSLNPDIVCVISKGVKDVHGVGEITVPPGVTSGSALVVVSHADMIPDTVVVEIRGIPYDEFLRLVDAEHPDTALDTIMLDTDQSMTVKVQRISTFNPVWVDATGYWSVSHGTLPTTVPVPSTPTGVWHIEPIAAGSAILTVTSAPPVSVSVPVIFRADSGAYRLIATLLTSPDSCFAGKPIKIRTVVENTTGPVPGSHEVSLLVRDTLDNSHTLPLPYFTFNGRTVADSLDKSAKVTITDGIDTLEVFLYYIPRSPDSLHQIKLAMTYETGLLPAKTIPFMLQKDSAGIKLTPSFSLSYRDPIPVHRSPESRSLRIHFNENNPRIISVCSIAGRSICSFATSGNETVFRLPPGIYMLQVKDLATHADYKQKLFVQ